MKTNIQGFFVYFVTRFFFVYQIIVQYVIKAKQMFVQSKEKCKYLKLFRDKQYPKR